MIVSLDISVAPPTIPKRLYIERDIDFQGPDVAHNITMTDANTHTLSGYGFSSISGTTGYAKLLSENNTLFTSNMDGKWYLPDSGLLEEDVYLFYGEVQASKTYNLEIYNANDVPKQDKVIDASYVTALQGTSYDKATRTFSGLSYAPSVQSQVLKYYVAFLEGSSNKWHHIVLSSGWLNAHSTYAIPDLSALSGFATVWQGDNAVHAATAVYMSNKSISEMFKAERMYEPGDNQYQVVPGSKYESAIETIF